MNIKRKPRIFYWVQVNRLILETVKLRVFWCITPLRNKNEREFKFRPLPKFGDGVSYYTLFFQYVFTMSRLRTWTIDCTDIVRSYPAIAHLLAHTDIQRNG